MADPAKGRSRQCGQPAELALEKPIETAPKPHVRRHITPCRRRGSTRPRSRLRSPAGNGPPHARRAVTDRPSLASHRSGSRIGFARRAAPTGRALGADLDMLDRRWNSRRRAVFWVKQGEARRDDLAEIKALAAAPQHRILHRGARRHPAAPSIGVRRRERRVVSARAREAAGIHHALREIGVARERQRGVAQACFLGAVGRDEIRRAGGVADIVIGRLTALDAIACDQRLRRFMREHESELPGRFSASCTPEFAPRAPKGES